MGKKISKNHHEKKQQLNSLIKVLRPKVYITDSSSFKRLVQQLTGNGDTSIVSSPPPTYNNPDQTVNAIPIIDIEDDPYHAGEPESSLESSSDASSGLLFELCNQQQVFSEELHQTYSPIYLHGESCRDTSSEYLLMNQQDEDLLACGDLESWLLDMEPYPPHNSFNQIQQEVSIFDYELSWLL